MRRPSKSGLLILCACTGVACWVPAETGQRMQKEILALQAEMQAARKGVDEQKAALTEQMQVAEKQVEEVAAALADLRRAAHMTDADFGVQIERLIRELQDLRGTLELTEYRLGKIEGSLDGEGSMAERLETLEKNVADAGNKPPAAEVPKDKKQLLLHARKLAKEKKVAEARGVYRDIIKRWPGEPGVTDEAYYRLGDLYYDEKKFRSSLQEFIKVAEKFASGRYVDDALYKIGLCSMEIGNLEDAQIFFNEIIGNHKKSPLVRAAKGKLDEIKKRLDKERKSKKRKK
jgi:TolA-binding protein